MRWVTVLLRQCAAGLIVVNHLYRGCGKKLAANGQALRKQYSADQTAAAVDMYYSGMSCKQFAENMKDVFDVPELSKDTIHNWVKGYTALALSYMRGEVGEDGTPATASGKRILADVGDHWVADELLLKVGGQRMWCWNAMDAGHPVHPPRPPQQKSQHQ